jgi:hypothetical protein
MEAVKGSSNSTFTVMQLSHGHEKDQPYLKETHLRKCWVVWLSFTVI